MSAHPRSNLAITLRLPSLNHIVSSPPPPAFPPSPYCCLPSAELSFNGSRTPGFTLDQVAGSRLGEEFELTKSTTSADFSPLQFYCTETYSSAETIKHIPPSQAKREIFNSSFRVRLNNLFVNSSSVLRHGFSYRCMACKKWLLHALSHTSHSSYTGLCRRGPVVAAGSVALTAGTRPVGDVSETAHGRHTRTRCRHRRWIAWKVFTERT